MNAAHRSRSPETRDAHGRSRVEFVDPELPEDVGQMDWQALRSRLFSPREPLAEGHAGARRLHLRGSFDSCAVSALNTYQESLNSVNLEGSSNGKPANANMPPVAEVNVCGERGQA